MAAPSVSTRQSPSGKRMDDGFSTKVSFSRDTDIEFWEKTVQPPGIDGGDEIETTTMHNSRWRTTYPRQLRTLTEMQVTAAYDPSLYTSILSLVNVVDSVTVRFPDGSTLVFWGFLKNFEPNECQEGEQPECTITITPTNYDPNNDVEADPVVTSVSGT